MPLAKDMLHSQLRKPESAQDFHVLNVYKDPDFDNDVRQSFPDLTALINIKEPFITPSGEKDPQTKFRMYFRIEQLDDRLFYPLAMKYAVQVNDIKIYLMGRHHTGKVYGARRTYKLEPTSHEWVAHIPYDIDKKEYEKMWSDISHNKTIGLNKVSKVKPPKHIELLYAIFKQRQKEPPTTFSAIHMLYLDNKLPYYKRSKDEKIMYDAKKFEEYYNIHKPNPVTPI